MKFSPKSKCVFFFATTLSLGGCAHRKTASSQGNLDSKRLQNISLDDLEHAEFKDPSNGELRLEIARKRWCTGERGIAFDDWSWIAQNAPQGLALKAKGYLEKSKEQAAELDQELACRENR